LPAGATPIDFAYAVHTDIGNTCIACRINRRLAPLSQKLDSGDTVEIVTTASAKPNMSWLNFVATAKASSNIRHSLKHQATDDAVNLGRRLINQELGSNSLTLEAIDSAQLEDYISQHKLPDLDALLADIGSGKRLAYIVASALSRDISDSEGHSSGIGPMEIHGTEGIMIRYSRCCRPIPGDTIVGHVNAGHGIAVHRSFCNNIQDMGRDKDKTLALVWAETGDRDFDVCLEIEVSASRGIIASLATSAAQDNANVEKIDVSEKDARLTIVNLEISVLNRVHLAQVIKSMRKIPGVNRLSRT
jgi:guanosine-3',5'-bis(diphosphate) 3'-pyrophosphohydrolase